MGKASEGRDAAKAKSQGSDFHSRLARNKIDPKPRKRLSVNSEVASLYSEVVPRGTVESFYSVHLQLGSRNITTKTENNTFNVAVHIFTSSAISVDASLFKLQKCQNQNQECHLPEHVDTLLALLLGLFSCTSLDLVEWERALDS